MEIFTEAEHRALAFVSAANRGGYRPTTGELHVWLTVPIHRRGQFSQSREQRAKMDEVELWYETNYPEAANRIADPEALTGHLIRLMWLEADERNSLGLTPLGRALLRTVEADEGNSEVPTAVVLGAQNELAYPMLISRLVEAGRGLLIDPYLRLEQLLDVRTHTSIMRVLISGKLKKEDREAMAVLIKSGAAAADGPIELRVADKDVLHDRLIVGEGFVDTIGTSLNTVGRQHPTVLSPLPSAAANTMREQAEKWWADAEPLAVWPLPEADTST